MPSYSVDATLTDPSGDLTDGTKYVVQNQGTGPAFFAVSDTAFTAAPADALILGGINDTGTPSHLEYTYAATDEVRVWASDSSPAKVVFHALG